MTKKLIRIEWIKAANYNSTRVILGLHLFLFLAGLLIFSQIDFSMPEFNFRKLFKFPGIWVSSAYAAKWLNLLLTVYIIILIGNEFSFKTFRQNVIDGLSRKDIFSGKFLVMVSLSVYIAVLVFLMSIIFGLIFSVNISLPSMFVNTYEIFFLFIQTLGFMALAMFITVIFRNTALSIVMYLLYRIAIEPIIRLIFDPPVRQYFPSKVLSNLSPNLFDMFAVTGTSTDNFDVKDVEMLISDLPDGQLLIIGIAYTSLFLFFSYFILKRRNL